MSVRAAALIAGLFLLGVGGLRAAEPLPPAPSRYVTDKAGILSAPTIASLDRTLENFERQTSNQVLVYILPRIPEGWVMEDFTQRAAERWGTGQRQRNNGVAFFVFPGDRKLRIEVGYGLEGAIPDAVAKRIIMQEVAPAFRAGDYAGGITAAVRAIMAAARGEYAGNGRTQADRTGPGEPGVPWIAVLLFLMLAYALMFSGRSGTSYSGRGRRSVWLPSSTGGSWGGRGGFGGGGFSGGGGSFGGGGASGGW